MIAAVNQQPGITNDELLQDWMTLMVMCDLRLRKVTAVQERKFLLDATLQIDALWQTVRNGGSGAGIVVEDVKESLSGEFDSAGAPIYDMVFGFVALENRDLNFAPGTGTLVSARQIGRIIVDIFFNKYIQPFGLVFAKGVLNEVAHDWIDEGNGIYARRTSLRMRQSAAKSPTCDLLSIACAGGNVTLASTCPADGLQIFYTVDGSFPANDSALNPAAQLYAGPFAADPGTVVTAAAYAPGHTSSAVKQTTTPSQ